MTYLTCPRQYYYKYMLKLEPIEKPKPLRMGSAFSDALEQGDASAVHEAYKDFLYDNLWSGGDIEYRTVYKLAEQYLQLHDGEDGRREVEIDLPIDRDLRFVGYIDELQGMTTLIENKLKAHFTEQAQNLLPLDDQITGYVWALGFLNGAEPEFVDVLYRVTVKPALRKKKDETEPEFIARIERDIELRPDHYQREYTTKRTDSQVKEWVEETIECDRMIQRAEQSAVWPKNPKACQFCDMKPICLANTSDELAVAMDRFKTKEESR